MNWRLGFLVTAAACAVLPLVVPQHSLTILVEALILGLFAMSLDLLVGYCRLYSFGHAAAYGLGAYSYALILTYVPLPLPAAILLAVAVTILIAIPIAWICTRSTGVSFAMLTLAFAQLGYAMLFRFRDVTGGSDGLVGIPRHPGPFGIDWFQSKLGYYYLVLACLFGSYLLCRAIVRSPFGAVLAGIRENEAKTIALGYNTRAYKITTVVLAYGFGGLAGALYAAFAGFASPELFFWLTSGRVLIMVIVGGAGTLIGPILGGVSFVFLEHQLSQVTDLWPLIFGTIFMAFVMFAPQGIWGILTSRFRSRRAVRTPTAPRRHPVPLLECRGLVRRFGALVAVDGIDLAVEPGEIRAVIGPNGAGKSTVFNLITSVLRPSAGQVIFAGEDITGMPVHEVAQKGIARTFQLCHIFPALTVRENVRIAAQARDARRWQFLGGGRVLNRSASAADEAIARMRLTRMADATAAMLSHGDQRLLEIAMAIAQKPRLLMLDEPTQGLSIEETGRAVQILKDMLTEGDLSVLLVEHDMEVVFKLADYITVLHRGRVIADGSPVAVRASAEVRSAYLGGAQ